MAKSDKTKKEKPQPQKVLNTKSMKFLEAYLNNASPTGFESEGQKIWLDYIKPYIDEYMVDTYGTVVGVVNPKAEYKVVIEAHADETALLGGACAEPPEPGTTRSPALSLSPTAAGTDCPPCSTVT